MGLTKMYVWDRYKKIKSEFLTTEIENRNESGIDEEVTEKDNLVADICEQIEDARLEQGKGLARKRKNDQDLINAGEAVRNRALERMKRIKNSLSGEVDAECPSPPSLSMQNGRQDDGDDIFATEFKAAAVRHEDITVLQKIQLELNKSMLALEKVRLHIQEHEHIRSERRFTMDEERLSWRKESSSTRKIKIESKWNWNEKRGSLL
jgi:hypothetical protein